jgi:hypothetical protein
VVCFDILYHNFSWKEGGVKERETIKELRISDLLVEIGTFYSIYNAGVLTSLPHN